MTAVAGVRSGVPPRRVEAAVVAVEPWGGYVRVVLAGEPLGRSLPGQFLAVATGDADSAMVAARAFGVHDADPLAGTASVVVSPIGPGSRWLAGRRAGDRVPLTGPLGRPFTLPGAGATWVGVGGGYGSAALAWAARSARARGARAAVVTGAGTRDRLCDTPALRAALGDDLHVATDDGTAGRRGSVLPVLSGVLDTVLGEPDRRVSLSACGPMAMLAAVAAAVAARSDADRVAAEVAVEERMACGVGVCMTCVLPVIGPDGVTRMARSCTDGPVLPVGAVRWDAVDALGSAVPADAEGAPAVMPAPSGFTR
ncbi:MAG: dihydroorotate dehydrogenase electron transfer subunit [Kineosporiaceae bacterium]